MAVSSYCGTVLSLLCLLALSMAYFVGLGAPHWVKFKYHKTPYKVATAGLWTICIKDEPCDRIEDHYDSLQAFVHASRVLLYLGIIFLSAAVITNLLWLCMVKRVNYTCVTSFLTGVLTLLAALLGLTSTIVYGQSYSHQDMLSTEWAFWLLIASCALLCLHAGCTLTGGVMQWRYGADNNTNTYVVQYPQNGNDGKVVFVHDPPAQD